MIRFTFEEIKNFTMGETFYSRNREYYVDTEPVHHSASEFYGDSSEKVEWTGMCVTEGDDLNHQHHFVVQNSYPQDQDNDILIFKEL